MGRHEPQKKNADEILIKEIDSWKLSFSKLEQRLCIDTTGYHPFTLKLSKDDLQELIAIMDKMTKEGKI